MQQPMFLVRLAWLNRRRHSLPARQWHVHDARLYDLSALLHDLSVPFHDLRSGFLHENVFHLQSCFVEEDR